MRTDDANEEEEMKRGSKIAMTDSTAPPREHSHRQSRHHPINYKARTEVGGVISQRW